MDSNNIIAGILFIASIAGYGLIFNHNENRDAERRANKVIDEVRVCAIKAQEFQKNFVMKEGKCYMEVE